MSEYLYFALASSQGVTHVKVGRSKQPLKRIDQLRTGSSMRVGLLQAVKMRSRMHAIEQERQWHELLAPFKLRGEWFAFNEAIRGLIEDYRDLGWFSDAAMARFRHAKFKRHRAHEYRMAAMGGSHG